MKRHLARIKGDVATCMGVPYDVRFQMVENLKEISKSKEQKKKDQEASNYSPLEDSPEFEDVQEITPRGRRLSRGNSLVTLIITSLLEQHQELNLLLKMCLLAKKRSRWLICL